MQSALIVHSKHTEEYAKQIAKNYRDVEFLRVTKPPTEEVLNIRSNKDIVIGIGGGSVIDIAKIISKNKRCIAIPTTASGSAMTPYATIWGSEKITIPTKKPILKLDYNLPKNLPFPVRQSTTFDALSHAIESYWSRNATRKSKEYAKRAIKLINKYLDRLSHEFNQDEMNELITAGNLAGQAIAIATTNVIHAASYPITVEYGIDHGAACGMLLPYFVEFMDFETLPELFNLDSTEKLVTILRDSFVPPRIENFNPKLIAQKAVKYDKAREGPKKMSEKEFEKVLENVKV
jgi:alcohol dehydrogenase class IV